MADWLEAKLFISNERPIKIQEYVKVSHGQSRGVYLVDKSRENGKKLLKIPIQDKPPEVKGDLLNLWELVQPKKFG